MKADTRVVAAVLLTRVIRAIGVARFVVGVADRASCVDVDVSRRSAARRPGLQRAGHHQGPQDLVQRREGR